MKFTVKRNSNSEKNEKMMKIIGEEMSNKGFSIKEGQQKSANIHVYIGFLILNYKINSYYLYLLI